MHPGAKKTQQDLIKLQFALPADEWIIQLVPEDGDERTIRDIIPKQKLYSLEQVEWFRARNANGCHIYGRPNSTRYVLVDWDEDGADRLHQMKADGLQPSAVIETSPGKFQAWITVSADNLPQPVATSLAKLITHRYRADPGSADAYHVGRLPGLRNKKYEYRGGAGDGGPLVLLRTARQEPKMPDGIGALIKEAEQLAADRPLLSSSSARGACGPISTNIDVDPSRSPMTPFEAHEIYDAELQYQAERRGWSLPIVKGLRSHADYAVVYGLRVNYGYHQDDLAALLHYESEKAADSGLDYVLRTVRAAL